MCVVFRHGLVARPGARTGASRTFIDEAAQLLSALRLWAQNRCRSDRVVPSLGESGDVVVLREVAHGLRQVGAVEAETASWTIARIL